MLSVNTNVPAMINNRFLQLNLMEQQAMFEKVATGLFINRGKDDPAGLIASESLRAEMRQIEGEMRMLERADVVARTAEGGLGEVSDLLVEAQGLAVANANTGALSAGEIAANQSSIDSIVQTIDRLAGTVQFNGDKLLDGSATINVVGESFSIARVAARDLGKTEVEVSPGVFETYDLADVVSGGDASTQTNPALAADIIGKAAQEISTMRGGLGAFQKDTLEPAIRTRQVQLENTTAAESVIRDLDYAWASSVMAKNQILATAGFINSVAANNQPRTALGLLG